MIYIILLIAYIIFLRVGFYLTRTYIDIRAIGLTILVISIVSIATSKLGYIGMLINSALTFYLLCKLGGTDLWPDTILAVTVGIGLYKLCVFLSITKLDSTFNLYDFNFNFIF